jgi:hypothetical protein
MAKNNAFLNKLKAEAAAKERVKTEAHVEMDTIAMLLMIHDKFKAGPGRAPDALNDFLAWKLEIAETILKELHEDQSKKKELVLTPRDIAARLKEILGKEGWEKWHDLFPFVRDYWEW